MSGLGRTSVYLTAVLLAVAAVAFGLTAASAIRAGGREVEEAGFPPGRGVPGEEVNTDDRETGGRSELTFEPAPHIQPLPVGGGRRGDPYPRTSDEEILEAVNRDVFMPQRSPPLARYQLPGQREVSAVPEEQDPRRRRGPDIRVVGSGYAGGQVLALIQVDDSLPIVVLLGEEVQGYVLAAVDEDGATLVGESETLELPVVASLETGRSLTSGPDPQSVEAMQERVQQILRQQMMNARRQNPNRGGRGGGGQP